MKRVLSIFLGLLLGLNFIIPAFSSSHREAPGIAKMPKLDGTDFYVFNSYESGKSDFVTIIANYQPLQDGYGGPNFFTLDPNAVYEIHIDNNGDAVEDLTFQFKFKNTVKNIALGIGGQSVKVPFFNVGAIGPNATDNSSTNVVESYTVNLIKGQRRKGAPAAITNADSGAAEFTKPSDNVGTKSIASYEAYAKKHIYNVNLPGSTSSQGKVFVGQRKEGFAVDLGGVFDLVNLNPLGATDATPNTIGDKNVTTIALEIPKAFLLGTSGSSIIGAWTTSSLPVALANKKQIFTINAPKRTVKAGLVQVSRLSAPLVNEVIIGLADKDVFNNSEPKDDAQFASYVTNPTLPAILEILFSSAGYKAPTVFPRTDLVSAFLTGVDGLNKTDATAEIMRLNTSIAAVTASQQKTLGVIDGDNAGFPNGRRPGDDVVDIELRVASGVLLPVADAPAGQLPLTDGVSISADDFDQTFPYLKSPNPGKS
jgi:hypothetical protein